MVCAGGTAGTAPPAKPLYLTSLAIEPHTDELTVSTPSFAEKALYSDRDGQHELTRDVTSTKIEARPVLRDVDDLAVEHNIILKTEHLRTQERRLPFTSAPHGNFLLDNELSKLEPKEFQRNKLPGRSDRTQSSARFHGQRLKGLRARTPNAAGSLV